jgi:predicted O-methyltransferase YrrM
MEHFYDNLGQDWFNYGDLYSSIVKKFPSGSHFIEIGSWKGRSAVYMAVEIINSDKKITFDCIDHWNGSWEHLQGGPAYDPITDITDGLYNEFLNNIKPVNHIINPIRMSSVEASNLYENESLDFVFIDAGHEYEDVKNDIITWLPKIKKGGILAGHDFNNDSPGVVRAVKEILPNAKHTSLICWIYEK